MGIHKEPRTRMYWNTKFNQGFYKPLQAIFPFAALSKSNDTAISLALRVINRRGITYQVIRSGGISLNLLLQLYKNPPRNTTLRPLM